VSSVHQANLILGLAAGYHYGDVRPFLSSLERSGTEGECVLFVSETTRDIERMQAHGVTVIPLVRPQGTDDIPYNALRYFLYRTFLASSEIDYARVLITDVRDVLFQQDPFGYPWPQGINCTLEERRISLGACPHNSHWVREHLGEKALALVADGPISCSGTSVGSPQAMIGYLDAMINRLLPFAGGVRMAGYDQGVHNVLLHDGSLSNVTLHDNSGPIMTLGYTLGEPELDRCGRVLNEKGKPAVIVHQYDRKPQFFTLIRKRFA